MNDTVQMVLTYTIVVSASAYLIYKLYKTLLPKKEETVGCGSNCGCDSIKLRKEYLEIRKSKRG